MSDRKTFLSNKELKKYISGAVYYDESDGLIPYRFTKEKMETTDDPARKIRHSTGAGIKIEFYSDTEELSFNYTAYVKFVSGIYKLYYFDVYADDALVLHQGEKDVSEDRTGTVTVKFKPGEKRITIYLPSSCAVKITDFSITEGAKISPVAYGKKTIFFGDSITHAPYVDFPSLSYANLISKKLNYNMVNQAIGGDVFSKHHLEMLPEIDFETVFVAYGTNDWRWANDSTPKRVEEFFDALKNLYTNAEKYVILPIWRADLDEREKLTYSFEDIRKMIKETASKYKIKVIDVFDLIPHDTKLYYDEYLHPNEMGFLYYADEIGKCLVR